MNAEEQEQIDCEHSGNINTFVGSIVGPGVRVGTFCCADCKALYECSISDAAFEHLKALCRKAILNETVTEVNHVEAQNASC